MLATASTKQSVRLSQTGLLLADSGLRLQVANYAWGRTILIRTYIDGLESLNGDRWLMQ